MNKVILILLAIFFPPVAVALVTKSLGKTLISLVLSCLFWIPGMAYALWVVLSRKAS